MAYSTANPPSLTVEGGIGNQLAATWRYANTDAATAVRVTGYVTNAKALGMKAGDGFVYTKTDASPLQHTSMIVAAINANGSADLTDGTAIGGANTD